jgi:hypothetical protein
LAGFDAGKTPIMTIRVSLLLAILTGVALCLVACIFPSDPKPVYVHPDSAFTVGSVRFPNDTVFARANLTTSVNGRVTKFFDKCAAGEDLTIGYIGGSITVGPYLTHQSARFSSLLTSWLHTVCPSSPSIREVNVALSATNSRFAASRVATDLLVHSPDLVVIEFAVNDYISGDDDFIRAALEGLVRQCLAHDPEQAVILLFTAKADGNNVQSLHAEIGRHYHLPMISSRDALWPLVESGRLAWTDVFLDDPHLSETGHRMTAHLLYRFLLEADRAPTNVGVALPAPYQSDLYQKAGILTTADTSVSVTASGWTAVTGSKDRRGFLSSATGNSVLTLTTNHREIALGLRMQTTDTSTVYLKVGDGPETPFNNFYVLEYTRVVRQFSNPSRQPQTVTIRHTGSKPFLIDYVLYAE